MPSFSFPFLLGNLSATQSRMPLSFGHWSWEFSAGWPPPDGPCATPNQGRRRTLETWDPLLSLLSFVVLLVLVHARGLGCSSPEPLSLQFCFLVSMVGLCRAALNRQKENPVCFLGHKEHLHQSQHSSTKAPSPISPEALWTEPH